MIIKFSYYEDEDFGLTAFPEIRFSEKKITKNKRSEHLEKKKEEYTKYLITGIMEDFPDVEIIDIFLPQLEKVEAGKVQETLWDGQAFQHKINKEKVEFENTMFGICEEYPLWECKFEEYRKVFEGWKKFLEMEVNLKSEVAVEI